MKKLCSQVDLLRRARLVFLLLLFSGSPGNWLSSNAEAAVLSWTGNAANGNWNDDANWGFIATPTNGDTLIFSGGAMRPTNTNNIPNLTLNQIRFVAATGGYNIYGNTVTVTNNIVATNTVGTNTVQANLVLQTNLTVEVGSGAGLVLSNSISGSATLTKIGTGMLLFSGAIANSYTNTTFVNAGILLLNKTSLDGSLHGPLIIGDGIGPFNSDIVLLANNEQLSDFITPVTVNSSGLFNLNGISEVFGSLSGNGNVALGNATARPGGDNGSATFSGTISGTGGLSKIGSGTQTLTGNNTYTGSTSVDLGTLIVNGFQQQSPVNVLPSATLGGNGVVGRITGSGGNIAPGSSPGILTCSNLTLSASTIFKVELNGPIAGTNYDQLNVRGTNNLAGAGLSISANFTSPVGLSNELVIIENDGSEGITGSFAGYPDGTTYDLGNGYNLVIRYVGGSGNDVSFIVTQLPGATAGSIVVSGNGNGLIDPSECNNLYVVITNKTGTPMNGITATLSSATPEVVVTQPYSSYPSASANDKSTNRTAFQISTLPGFVCGSNILLNLAVTTASHGAFIAPSLLPSGAVSVSPSRFDINTITNVPDVGTIESTNIVSSFDGQIAKVAVSLWLNSPLGSDMSISLISPDDVIVDLSSGNGAGSNFGTNCAPDVGRTTFDDSAATVITAGSSPFVGTFRPEGNLAAFKGGTANGNWRLRINDAFVFSSPDTLRCWSLFLYPLTCTPGSGPCDLCPNTTIFGAIGQDSLVQSDRLTRDSVVSTCDAPKGCAGDINHGPREYDAHTFQNGPSNACITVTLTTPTDLMSVAYLGYFDPLDHCTNYLADSGDSTGQVLPVHPISYSFNVASNAVFVVTVNSVEGERGPYQLSVTGGDCRPVLKIAKVPSTNARVDWPTWASGYHLESTPSLTSPSWNAVTNNPIVTNNRYTVTNNTGTANKFYRLSKP